MADSPEEKKAPWHPIKGKKFFAVPEEIASRPDITDSLYRLLSIILPRYSEKKEIRFKIKDLAPFMNKSGRRIRETVKYGVNKGYFKTTNIGKGLEFTINKSIFGYSEEWTDSSTLSDADDIEWTNSSDHKNIEWTKTSTQSGRKRPTSYNKERVKQNDKNGLVFIKTKREPGAGRIAPPAPASKKNKTEWIRELIPPEKRKLIKFGMRRDIEKLFPDDEIERLIKNAFSEGKNPPAYIQGAILRKRQSLTKPTSDEAPPPNPKKNPANQYGIETKNGESVGVLWNAFLGETIKTDIEKFNEFLEYNTRDLSKIPEFVDYLRKEKAI